ncbi:MAG: putative metal-dependent phosphoesterase [Elusimicrobia bacterium]|nr:MAG: putative metal-dependent phosphoesterase [Elusimicrobiota bacterium]KAF0152341.1 MAG: putative metal-dependent phosphoesterase [Elusimicrobiota bacterium]
MTLINLHNHSSYSDGTLKPAELAAEAARAGISYFSLTDHDAVGGWPEMEPALKERGIKYCYGVEIGAAEHEYMHILGYGIAPADPGLNKMLADIRQAKVDRVKKAVGFLSRMGVDVTFEELPWRGGCPPSFYQLGAVMRDKGFASSRGQADKLYLAPGRPAYAERPDLPAAAVIKAIRAAGGKAVLAHPYSVGGRLDLESLKDAGLEGLEVYYPAHDEAAVRKYLEMAAHYGLFITAGFDFHGPGTERDKMSGYDYSPDTFKTISELFV